eukprot:403363569
MQDPILSHLRLQLWDIKGKAKCLKRLKPSKQNDLVAGKQNNQSQNKNQGSTRFTTLQFAAQVIQQRLIKNLQNDYVLVAGLSDGSLQLIDCSSAQVLKDLANVSGNSSVNAVQFYRKQDSVFKMLIASEDNYVIFDYQKQSVIDSIISSQQKKKTNPTPQFLDLSYDDQYAIEGYQHQINLRNLKNKHVIAKFEGHQYNIRNLAFATNTQSYLFISSANSECLLWNPKEQLKQQSAGQVLEVSKPDKILDLGATDNITLVSVKELEDSIFMAAVSTENYTNLYYTKSSGQQSSQTQMNILHGSVFAIKKSLVSLTNDQGKIEKDIMLGKYNEEEEKKNLNRKQAANQDGYAVTGIEEEGNAKVNGLLSAQLYSTKMNLSLIPELDGDHLESRLTSVSSKKQSIKPTSGSLSVILSQALTADDTETLDWILGQKDQQMITSTIVNMKEHKHISALFKQIVIKFQQEGGSSNIKENATQTQQSVVMWLKTLLALHWSQLLKKADKEDLKSLGAIQSYIQKKTKYMDKVMLLKGKLEMLQNTIEIRKQISQGLTQQEKSAKNKQPMLVYKDAEDDEDELMKDEQEEEDEEDNDSEDEEEEDEEIREIDIKNRKRARKDNADEEEDDEDLDDSIDEEESKKDDEEEMIVEEDEEIDSDVYGGEDDDEDDVDNYDKLVESSDDNGGADVEMQEESDEEDEPVVKKSAGKRSTSSKKR